MIVLEKIIEGSILNKDFLPISFFREILYIYRRIKVNTLREIQLFQLQMLKDVAKVCDENNIDYMLSSGTLLGAVRHGGFIPWDDDIDICMTLQNYNKFLKIGQEKLGDRYFVQNYKTEKNYNEFWTQIRANNTTSMPIKCKDMDIHWGICIDIFPLVGVSKDIVKAEKQRKALSLCRMLISDKYLKAIGEKITLKMKIIYLFPRKFRRWLCTINEKRFMLDMEKEENCAFVWYDFFEKYPVEIFKEYTNIYFEDAMFKTMSKKDEYLTIAYGDYMIPPPIDKQGGHSDKLGDIIMDINKDYREYKKQLYEET